MNLNKLRQEVTRSFMNMRNEPDMPLSLACASLSQVLMLMEKIHNESIAPKARNYQVFPPHVGDKEVKLLRHAFNGDTEPLMRWLRPRVPYEPRLLCDLLP